MALRPHSPLLTLLHTVEPWSQLEGWRYCTRSAIRHGMVTTARSGDRRGGQVPGGDGRPGVVAGGWVPAPEGGAEGRYPAGWSWRGSRPLNCPQTGPETSTSNPETSTKWTTKGASFNGIGFH